MPGTITPLVISSPPGVIPANWVTEIRMTHTYENDVTEGATVQTEERRLFMSRPERILKYRMTAMERKQLNRMLEIIRQAVTRRWPFPIAQDATEANALSAAAGTDFYCDVTNGRFYEGGKAVVYNPAANGYVKDVKYVQIVAIHPTYLELNLPLDVDYVAGNGVIVPCMDVEMSLETAMEPHHDRAGSLDIVALEVLGPSALPSYSDWPPSHFNTVSGDPVLNIDPDWSAQISRGYLRDGVSIKIGRAQHVYGYGEEKATLKMALVCLTRAAAFRALEFLDASRGRQHAWWVISPMTTFTYVSHATHQINVAADGDLSDVQRVKYVAVLYRDKSLQILAAPSAAMTDNGDGTWKIPFTGTVTLDSAQVDIICEAHHVRMASDSFDEVWTTDGICRFDVSCVEIKAEANVVITSLPTVP